MVRKPGLLRGPLAAVVVVAAVGAHAPAVAAWSHSGAGYGHARASVITTPAVSATCDNLLSTTIHVNWTANPAPLVDQFAVQRSTNGGTTWTTVATLPATTDMSYHYDDSGLALATYTFRITASNQSWAATSTRTQTRTVALLACL